MSADAIALIIIAVAIGAFFVCVGIAMVIDTVHENRIEESFWKSLYEEDEE